MFTVLHLWNELFWWNKIIVISLLLFIIYLFYDDFKKNKYNKYEDNYIQFRSIPPLTRIIHHCTSIDNIRYTTGDLIELESDGVKTYYVCGYLEISKLTIPQVKRLEIIYNMKIL